MTPDFFSPFVLELCQSRLPNQIRGKRNLPVPLIVSRSENHINALWFFHLSEDVCSREGPEEWPWVQGGVAVVTPSSSSCSMTDVCLSVWRGPGCLGLQ